MILPEYFQEQITGTSLTTMKVGGPVRFLAKPRNRTQLLETLEWAKQQHLPIKIIGGGSNLILSDQGFAGVLVQPAFTEIQILPAEENSSFRPTEIAPRYNPQQGEQFLALHEREEVKALEKVQVEMGAGVPWGQAVARTLKEGLGGLHYYARIPCQVGGAVYNNIHGQKHYLSEVIAGIRVLNYQTGEEYCLPGHECRFDYDYSIAHIQPLIILSAIFELERVPLEVAEENRQLYLDWTKEKARVQPAGPSCGSVFANITAEQAASIGQPSQSAGWYIDQAGMKGRQIGGMQVAPSQANFIVNRGQGTAADFIALVKEIQSAVYAKFKLYLELEAECIDEQGERISWPKNG